MPSTCMEHREQLSRSRNLPFEVHTGDISNMPVGLTRLRFCEHSVVGASDVTEPLSRTFRQIYPTNICVGTTKGRAMILFILLPLLILVSAVGVFSMTFEDPDRVASNYSPYVEIGR